MMATLRRIFLTLLLCFKNNRVVEEEEEEEEGEEEEKVIGSDREQWTCGCLVLYNRVTLHSSSVFVNPLLS